MDSLSEPTRVRVASWSPHLPSQTSRRVDPRSHRPRDDRYEVKELIAAGGMGLVYRVRDRITGEDIALKRIAPGSEPLRVALDRFEFEYQVLASLDHPRIIRVIDYGLDDQGPYYTMELLDGGDLLRAAPVPFQRACLLLRDVATSLALLHGRRLLHRDLSPSNVRVTSDGHCKLIDFGALTPFGASPELVGTAPFVAPEALAGAPLDQRTDLYGLGALAYCVLTGRHAFPVQDVLELTDHWSRPLAAPSRWIPSVPKELDALVLSLLSRDPLARPGSAAEVIARLEVIGALPVEDRTQTDQLAQSCFARPNFSGRASPLRELSIALEATLRGRGAAVRIEAAPGLGTTRLLEEFAVRARMAGATVVSLDASSSRQLQGTSRALASRLVELVPELAREHTAPPVLAEFVAEISREHPLVIEIDNLEDADAASQALLASLASLAGTLPLMLVLGTALEGGAPSTVASSALRRHSQTILLSGLSIQEMLGMLRSIFGDAPNLERFGEWVHELTAGGPLHAIEVCRSLFASGVIRYASGFWTLPTARPNAKLPMQLGDALTLRLESLGVEARALAECLSLQRDKPSLELCTQLCADAPDPATRARSLLEKLTHAGVLAVDRGVYRFSSSALRDALLQGMKAERLELNHRRLGDAFAQLASADDHALHIEAGFHLIEGAEYQRGAELIAKVTADSATYRRLVANLYRGARPIEAAFKVQRKERRSAYEQGPLLAALALSGYYEDREFGEQYGDQALDVLEALTGLDRARRMRRYVGRPLSLVLGVSFAYLQFLLTPRASRPCSFAEIIRQLLSTVNALAGTAALSLDAQRAERVASILEPFAFLSDRATPVGMYQLCMNLGAIARENEVATFAAFERSLKRFSNPRNYPALPGDARTLLVAGVHFARGSLAAFRADSSATLESANALDAIGLKLYAMIASQLRFLYHIARGEFSKAAPHRDQIELHAAYVGSAWQVETWEGAALTLIHAVAIEDVVSLARVSQHLEVLSRSVPSLRRYSRLASLALIVLHRDERYFEQALQSVENEVPRSYIGWAAVCAVQARSYNRLGDYDRARSICLAALAHVTDADREFVALFLALDIEMAIAEAGLGRVDAALARVDGLLARFAGCDHPLLQGLLHECRGRVAWQAGALEDYRRSLSEVERWFRPTGTPGLIAKIDRLAALANDRTVR